MQNSSDIVFKKDFRDKDARDTISRIVENKKLKELELSQSMINSSLQRDPFISHRRIFS